MLKWTIENGCAYGTSDVFVAHRFITLGCFIGKSCTVLGCQSAERKTHLCAEHTELVRGILAGVFYDDVLRMVIDVTAAC